MAVEREQPVEQGGRALARREAWRRRSDSAPWQFIIVAAGVVGIAAGLAGTARARDEGALGARVAGAFAVTVFVRAAAATPGAPLPRPLHSLSAMPL